MVPCFTYPPPLLPQHSHFYKITEYKTKHMGVFDTICPLGLVFIKRVVILKTVFSHLHPIMLAKELCFSFFFF